MKHPLPQLPWARDALAPHISPETIEFHYGKHHQAYVNKLNTGIEGTEYENMALEDIIKKARGPLFNNAAQVWNHTFYWNSLNPKGGGPPTGVALEAINQRWGTFDKFREQWNNSAATNFGSGWTWWVKKTNGEMDIVNTDDAGCPLTDGHTPILTIDVWEHAYYIDYRNDRPRYIDAFWNLVNWEFASKNLS